MTIKNIVIKKEKKQMGKKNRKETVKKTKD